MPPLNENNSNNNSLSKEEVQEQPNKGAKMRLSQLAQQARSIHATRRLPKKQCARASIWPDLTCQTNPDLHACAPKPRAAKLCPTSVVRETREMGTDRPMIHNQSQE